MDGWPSTPAGAYWYFANMRAQSIAFWEEYVPSRPPPIHQWRSSTPSACRRSGGRIEDSNSSNQTSPNSFPSPNRYLERDTLTQYPNSHIILLRPSMSFMLMQTPDPSTLKDALPNFASTTHIFLPINDCADVKLPEGGSHWSLLLVSLLDGLAFHYDSMHPSNHQEAALATLKIAQLTGKPVRFVDLDDAPQQENSSDCGVFVCVLMRHLLVRKLLRTGTGGKADMSLGGRKVDAAAGRKEMLKIIEGFRREGEKRRS